MTAMWLGALRRGRWKPPMATRNRARWMRPGRARRARIRQHCWDPQRGLFADNPDRDVFSQHMNVFAVLTT